MRHTTSSTLHNPAAGTYLLEVLSPQFYFSQVGTRFVSHKTTTKPHHPRPIHPSNPNTHTLSLSRQVKISVRPEAADPSEQVLCLEYKYPGAPKLKTAHPLLLRAHSAYQYFEPRNRWGPLLAQLSSPMTWMLLVSVLVAVYMPSMMDGLSEEEKARLNAQSNPSALFQELLGGGGGGGTGGAGGAAGGGARPAAGGGGGGGGRR